MKQVSIYGVLLGLSLLGTYVTWFDTDADDTKADDVAVFEASEVSALAWDSGKLQVSIEQRSDARGSYPWVSVTETREVRKPRKLPHGKDAKAKSKGKSKGKSKSKVEGADTTEDVEATEPPPELKTTVTSFRGSAAAEALWKDFAPLHAKRQLDTKNVGDTEAFGFDGDKAATLTVTQSSGTLTLKVGGETYGAKDRYLGLGDKVFLVDKEALRPLQFAKTRLLERRLHPLDEKDIEQVEVRTDAGSVMLVQGNRDDRTKAFWARGDSPEAEDSSAGTWLGKVFKIKVQQYVDEADVDKPLSTAFTLTLRGNDEAWGVEVLKGPGDNPSYYARSEYDRGLVQLTRSLASDAVADVESVISP